MWGRDSPPDQADEDMEGKEPSSKAEPQSPRGISNDESLFDEIRAEHLVNRSRGIGGLLLLSEESEAEGVRSSTWPSQGLCPGGISVQDKPAYSKRLSFHRYSQKSNSPSTFPPTGFASQVCHTPSRISSAY